MLHYIYVHDERFTESVFVKWMLRAHSLSLGLSKKLFLEHTLFQNKNLSPFPLNHTGPEKEKVEKEEKEEKEERERQTRKLPSRDLRELDFR